MKEVRVYTTNYCPYCTSAKRLLGKKGVAFTEVDVTGNDAMRLELVKLSDGMKTVPQIFIGEQHIGGFGDLQELDEAGGLDPLLADVARAPPR